jgi:hypothetical protein
MFMFLSIYLIVGIVYLAPFLVWGIGSLSEEIERIEINWKSRLWLGFGMLINVLFWPVWLCIIIYKLYIRD